jgi:hypothetical protein
VVFMSEPLMILVAGPYRSGTNDDRTLIKANVDAMTDTALKLLTVRLLQVDVAIRDSRARTTTGWVFGTFVYDGNATGETPWDRLVPVGVMWGNDPRVTTPTATRTTHLKQTFVNSNLGPSQHLGRREPA